MALDAQFVGCFTVWIDLARGVSGCPALSRERSNGVLHCNAVSCWQHCARRFSRKQRCVVSRAPLRNRPQGGVRFDSSLHEHAPAGKLRHEAMVESGARNFHSGHWLLRDGRNCLVSSHDPGRAEPKQGSEAISARAFARLAIATNEMVAPRLDCYTMAILS